MDYNNMSSDSNSQLIIYLLKQSQKHSEQIDKLKRKQRHLKKSVKNNRKNMLCAYRWLDSLDSHLKEQTDIHNYRYSHIERILFQIRKCNKHLNRAISSTYYETETDSEEDSSSDYNTEDENNDETDESDESDEEDDEDSSSEDECDEVENIDTELQNIFVEYDGDSSSDYDSEDECNDEEQEQEN
jgi:hypothetical protein